MQQPATSEPSRSSAGPTFAGMLAALASPGQKRPPARDLDGFEEDVATLSYERALRVHARFRTPDRTDQALTQLRNTERPIADDLPAVDEPPAAPAHLSDAPELLEVSARNAAGSDNATGHDRNLRCASVTFRLSKAEFAQLRTRAAEAGLTVSAYLRSCTLEAESLRAQVKEMIVQLRSEAHKETKPAEIHPESTPARGSWLGRLRFWPHENARQEST